MEVQTGKFARIAGNTPSLLLMGDHSQYTADLSSYESACRHDLDLQLFDSTIHARTSRVLSSLASGVEVHSLSFDSLRDVTDSLLEMNQDVVKVILESKKDIWNNQELFPLVDDYFEYSIHILDFCAAIDKCLRQTRDRQLYVQIALKYFEEESQNVTEGTKYVKTLQELKRFKESGNPFTDEFFVLLQSVYKQQLSLFERLHLRKRKLDKKLKSLKIWRRLSNIIFVAAFISVMIFSVVAAAVAAPPVVTALAGSLSAPVGSVGKWCNSLFNRYESGLKRQKEVISAMQVGTVITMKDLDHIEVLVQKLEIEIQSLVQNADFTLNEEDAVKIGMDEIKKNLGMFTETIESLSKQLGKCVHETMRARVVVTKKIIQQGDLSVSFSLN